MAKSLDFRAFPDGDVWHPETGGECVEGAPGMTYAEYLFAKAVGGLAANPAGYDTDVIVKMAFAIVHETREFLKGDPAA